MATSAQIVFACAVRDLPPVDSVSRHGISDKECPASAQYESRRAIHDPADALEGRIPCEQLVDVQRIHSSEQATRRLRIEGDDVVSLGR